MANQHKQINIIHPHKKSKKTQKPPRKESIYHPPRNNKNLRKKRKKRGYPHIQNTKKKPKQTNHPKKI